MADTDMTESERDEFLDGVHVGILSIARDGKGPLALPVWYDHVDGEIEIRMSYSSLKARLLREQGRATFTVQDERLPYRYVMVEGPVTVTNEPSDVTAMATRYLGDELGAQYAAANPPSDDSATVRIRPERYLTCDYGKVM
jgi:nitroimidazol reductase NimA-like FMN-containing flavoprotein (pyridoxamine 5'-phosphate oxidase superfamily)